MILSQLAFKQGGSIHPLIVPSNMTDGTSVMNPSVYNDDGKLMVTMRHIDCIVYGADKGKFRHQWGFNVYPKLTSQGAHSTNFYGELDKDLSLTRIDKIDTSAFDTYQPNWYFTGLEDPRLFRWDGKLYHSGVRRDTTPNGQGRMELSEIQVNKDSVVEVSRVRIENPIDHDAYCEKNWMPVLDKPYHYVKWCDPTEIVTVDPKSGKSTQKKISDPVGTPNEFRGGSHLLPFGTGYISLIHDVVTTRPEGQPYKNTYYHRFVLWDKELNIVSWSPTFSFIGSDIEFAAGMCYDPYNENTILISFGYQDNLSFILRTPVCVIQQQFQ